MWKQQPDSKQQPEKPDGEGWIVNESQQLVCQFSPDNATDHSQWVTIRTFHWRLPDDPIPQSRRRMLSHQAVEAWQTMRHSGWRRCSPPMR
ncbi:MAG: hypothetical protein CL862_05720 [Cyanobium sp. NAT70]|nr:hypothetical protein [Cyanobium sp. NAT70]